MFSGLRADLTKAFSLNPLYVASQPAATDTDGLTFRPCHSLLPNSMLTESQDSKYPTNSQWASG